MVKCPICHGTNARSKVHDGKEWWYVCDDQQRVDHGKIVLPDGTHVEVSSDRWYFNEGGQIEHPKVKGLFRINRQERAP